ncbi:MAG TPA: class I SAM-dependent methyltransferase [Methanoregulaceae archaeon]|nr:class I SAM-dependent methyltransferase [Methanoregulaceae archaeon]
MKPADIDRIYRDMPQEKIPWNIEAPPDELVEIVTHDIIRPSRAVDLGCGAGNYAIYLASIGFDVTGIDSSPAAIKIAKENAEKKGVRCNFIVADLLGDLHEVDGKFDFAYDWELLHHIFPADRTAYIDNVFSILNPGALYLSVCFSEEDPQFGGVGKYRKTPLGTILYFSSESEIEELFAPYFYIRDIKTKLIRGKYAPHCAVYVLSERR